MRAASPDILRKERFYRIILVLEGTHTLEEAGTTTRCPPGSIYFLRPGQSIQCIASHGAKANLIAFTVTACKFKKKKDKTSQGLWPPLGHTQPQPRDIWNIDVPLVLAKDINDTLRALILEIVINWWQNDHLHFLANHRLMTLLEAIYTHYTTKHAGKIKEISGQWQLAIVPLIEHHLPQLRTADDIALLAKISLRQLHRYFKDAIGESPAAYLRRRRVERAAALLRNSSHTIQDIVLELGYSSPAAFNNVWKKYYHLSPTQWRAKSA